MQTPLFLDATIGIEKVAASTRLEQDADRWAIEITKVAYKSVPSLKNYETDVELDRVDGARGYAVGKMLVYPFGLTKEAASGRDKLISLPVIVRDHELSPFDVYVYKGQMYPMDESDVQEILIRTETYSRTASDNAWTGTNLGGQLVPPSGGDGGYGATQKTASARGIWKDVLSTATSQDFEQVKVAFEKDFPLLNAYMTSPYLVGYMRDMPSGTTKLASEARRDFSEMLAPTVVQFRREAQGVFLMKTASSEGWAPREERLDRFQTQAYLGTARLNDLLENDVVTFVVNPVHSGGQEKVASNAERLGVYEVISNMEPVRGTVIPHMLSLDNKPMGMQVFAGPSGHVLQEKVAGVYLHTATLPVTEPRGLGVYVYQEGDTGIAYEPIEVLQRETVKQADGSRVSRFHCKLASTGESITLYPRDDVHRMERFGGPTDFAVPTSCKFLPLSGEQHSLSAADTMNSLMHIKHAGAGVTVMSEGNRYRILGENAELFSGDSMTDADTEFALGGLGISRARELLKTAKAKGIVKIATSRHITTIEEMLSYSTKVATSMISHIAQHLPKCNTFKEAALLVEPDGLELMKTASSILTRESLDAILSLNFMTPETASIYINYLPLLEKTSSALAELVVASRLGMDDVREAAAVNAMTQVNAVVKGLEKLSAKVQ